MAPGSRKTVVLTGASGTIAGLVLEALRERYYVRALDLRASDGIEACDLLGLREAIRPFFAGADAVVHMAFVPPPSGVSSATTGPGHDSDGGSSADGANEKLFSAEHRNVEMAFNVFQTASEEGVSRVVMASSNHAADYYEELILDHK
jgi:nucleoside-diphosphate-sugar epimerase